MKSSGHRSLSDRSCNGYEIKGRMILNVEEHQIISSLGKQVTTAGRSANKNESVAHKIKRQNP
jgi:transketolase C-terminal domain/subunit